MNYSFMGNNESDVCLIELYSSFDENLLDREVGLIKEAVECRPFAVAALKIEGPNCELSPWQAPAAFGNEDFGDGALQTLSYITNTIIPEVNTLMNSDNGSIKFILGGYSLAGLFSLWAGYESDKFYGIAAVSPSVWFPKWDKYIEEHSIQTKKVYLSLGDREHMTKNQVMSKVLDRINEQYDLVGKQLGKENCTLEWNEGNHFNEPEIRKAKGYSWVLKGMK